VFLIKALNITVNLMGPHIRRGNGAQKVKNLFKSKVFVDLVGSGLSLGSFIVRKM
jgi:hypothetical protein